MIQIFFALLFFNHIYAMTFHSKIEAKRTQCFGEFLTENTVAIFRVTSTSNNINVEIKNTKNQIIYSKENQKDIKVSLTASESGNHGLCISNQDNKEIVVVIDFLSGIAAKDYTELAKQSNLKPIEINLQKLEDSIVYLIKELANVVIHQETTLAANETLSFKIVIFSLVTLLSMVIVGICETIFIKRFLYNKKIV